MPTSINLAKYPQGMLDIIESICETRHDSTVAYPNTRLAQAARLQFYGLVRALVINHHSLAFEATRLKFTLSGISKNILTIAFPEDSSDDAFYSAQAARIIAEHDTKGDK